MLADERGARDLSRRHFQLSGKACRQIFAQLRVRQAKQHLARGDLRMLEHLFDCENWPGRDSLVVEYIDPMLGRVRCERVIDFFGERGAILDATAAAPE